MKTAGKLILIGFIGAIVLAGFLKIIQLLTGNDAYILLIDVDYVPILNNWSANHGVELFFHFATSIFSVLALFYILKLIHMEKRFLPYLIVYTLGGAILYSLTGLSERAPALTDMAAWGFWTFGHAIYAVVVGLLVKYWCN